MIQFLKYHNCYWLDTYLQVCKLNSGKIDRCKDCAESDWLWIHLHQYMQMIQTSITMASSMQEHPFTATSTLQIVKRPDLWLGRQDMELLQASLGWKQKLVQRLTIQNRWRYSYQCDLCLLNIRPKNFKGFKARESSLNCSNSDSLPVYLSINS